MGIAPYHSKIGTWVILLGMCTACTLIEAPPTTTTLRQQPTRSTAIDDTYQFPVLPGSDAWVQLESHQAMLDVTQVPDALLPQISTRGLVKTIFAYPLFGDMLAFFDLQEGFASVIAQFNGFQELFKRPDGAAVLLTYYQDMDPTAVRADWSLEEQGEYTFQFIYAEMILAQEPILSKLTQADRRMLVTEVLRKLALKEQAIDLYGYLSVQSSAFLLAKILYVEQDAPFLTKLKTNNAIKTFFDKGGNTEKEVLYEIITDAKAWVENR